MTLTDEQKFQLLQDCVRSAVSIPEQIPLFFEAICSLGQPQAPAEPEPEAKASPLTYRQWNKLIKDDSIISLIDEKPYKMLRRHLTQHGYTPQSYKEKFGLPKDFPLVAPAYARARSDLAKSLGLGKKVGKAK